VRPCAARLAGGHSTGVHRYGNSDNTNSSNNNNNNNNTIHYIISTISIIIYHQ